MRVELAELRVGAIYRVDNSEQHTSQDLHGADLRCDRIGLGEAWFTVLTGPRKGTRANLIAGYGLRAVYPHPSDLSDDAIREAFMGGLR